MPSRGYTTVKTLVIDNTLVGGSDLTNFPIVVSSTRTWLKTVANGGSMRNSSADDLAFYHTLTGSVLTLPLVWAIRSYNAVTGAILLDLKTRAISASAPTTIYAACGTTVDTHDWGGFSEWVFNSEGVWHMANAVESTGLYQSATVTGGSFTPSVVGNGYASTATSEFKAAVSGGNRILTNWTIAGWLKPTFASSSNTYSQVFAKTSGPDITGTTPKLEIYWNNAATGFNVLLNGQYWYQSTTNFTFSANETFHFAATFDKDASPRCKFYKNGALVTATQIAFVDANANAVTALPAFVNGQYVDYSLNFTGTMNEMRLYREAMTPGWIAASYNSQLAPETFYNLQT